MAYLYLKIKKYAEVNGVNNINFDNDVVLANVGNGDYIESWNLDIPKPSLESLEQYDSECDLEFALENLRFKRNNLLGQTDYLALSDQTMSAEMTTYRQALRDITNGLTTVEDVEAVVFPEKPEASL